MDARRVEFWSLWGNVDPATASEALIDHWVNAGADVPTPSDAHVHVNLWLMDGLAPTDGPAPATSSSSIHVRSRGRLTRS